MGAKLYFNVNNAKFTPVPKQMDAVHDYESVTWSLAPTATFSLSQKKAVILAEIDWEEKQIISIIKEFEFSKFVSDKEKEEVKKENISFFSKQKKKERKNPVVIPDNLFISEVTWDLLVLSLDINKYPLLIGPKGCGKTSIAQDLALATKRDFFPINCGAIFKPKQTLVGTVQAKEGTTFVIDSEFMKFFTSKKPTLIFLDEISRIPQGAANYFMTILDRIQSYIYVEEKGERIYKGEDVNFIAAANFGYEYTDTRNIDGALLDRFIKFMVDYLEETEELKLLHKRAPLADPKELSILVKNANLCRNNKDQLRVGVSTRQLIDMAHYLEKGISLNEVMDEIFINLFFNGTMDERDNVKKMIDATM